MSARFARLAGALALLLASACAGTPPQASPPGLAGTSWQFVRFQGGDDRAVVPDERAKYTVAFGADGGVSVRFDCNRGRGSWTSERPGQIQFGPMALTRAMCQPGSLHDQFLKHWPYVRSYVLKGGHLYLSLMADGGIYEFEPLAKP
ncbi:MAG TPA: META domain-containing protein [Burkholderiales bacterium]